MTPRTAGVAGLGALDGFVARSIARKRSRSLREILAPYEKPDSRRSALQLAVTLVLYGLAWAALIRSVEVGYWLTAILALPAGGLATRLIILQHDCGHGSYFPSRRACDAVGRVVAALALTPYDHAKTIHAGHHAHSGDLDRRVGGDMPALTVSEYEARGWRGRLAYRLVRNPFAFMGVLIPLQLLALNRFPFYTPRSRTREWRSVWWTNAGLVAALTVVGLAAGAEGVARVVIVQCMIALYAGAISGWINHAQHQFEGAYWRRAGEWDFFDAGLRGSSWLDLPRPLRWLTASMGLHHVHHLSSRIPNYLLQRCHDENPELHAAHRIEPWESLKGLRLALWDEERGRLISFGERRRRAKGRGRAEPRRDRTAASEPSTAPSAAPSG